MKFHLITVLLVWVCCGFAMPTDMTSYHLFRQGIPESRLKERSAFNRNTLSRTSVYDDEYPSCSLEDMERNVGCACYVGWRLRDLLNTEDLIRDCREEEADDLEELKVTCIPYLDEESRLPVQKFVSYTKEVQQTCFVQTLARIKLSHNVIRAEPSEPPKPKKLRKLLKKFLDILPDIDIKVSFSFEFEFGAEVDVGN